MAVADTEWWNENLHRPAILYLTRIKLAATVVEDGTAQLALERSVARTGTGKGARDRLRGSRKQPRKSQESSGPVYSLTERKFCDEFNTTAGCPRIECFGVP